MSQTAEAAFLLRSRGISRDLDAFVVAAAFSRDGRRTGFALGDGTVRIAQVGVPTDWTSVTVHDGAVLDFAPDPTGDGFISGGDDGKLRRIVVVGLGTNGDVTAEQIRQLRRAVGSDRYLVLVNIYGPMSWESEVNGMLAAAATHQSHVDLANWHQAIADHTGLLWPDGIHPQPSGAKLYAHVVLQAIQAELSSGKALPCQPTSFSTARAHG